MSFFQDVENLKRLLLKNILEKVFRQMDVIQFYTGAIISIGFSMLYFQLHKQNFQ